MNYPTLLFDLYGTLADIHTEDDAPVVWRKLALFYGYHGAHYAPKELRAAFHAGMAAQNATAGQSYEGYPDMPVEPVLESLFCQKGAADGARQNAAAAAQVLRLAQTRYIRLYPGVKAALAALRADGHRLILLSNAQAAFTAPELAHLGLVPYFDAVYLSSDHRCRKPDPRFFAVPVREHGLDPARCLMIGNDAATDIAGAKAAGMAALYLHTNISPAPAPADLALADHTWQGADWRRLLPFVRGIAQ